MCCCFIGHIPRNQIVISQNVWVRLGRDFSQQFAEVVLLIYVLCSRSESRTAGRLPHCGQSHVSPAVGSWDFVLWLCFAFFLTSDCLRTSVSSHFLKRKCFTFIFGMPMCLGMSVCIALRGRKRTGHWVHRSWLMWGLGLELWSSAGAVCALNW